MHVSFAGVRSGRVDPAGVRIETLIFSRPPQTPHEPARSDRDRAQVFLPAPRVPSSFVVQSSDLLIF
jgi:hypothetical protein